MSTAQLHVIGRGHEARFSEDFDQALANAIRSTPDPSLAAAELDDVALLTVLANFAGAGSYDPAHPPSEQLLSVLQIDPANPMLRFLLWDWWRSGTALGRFGFTGRTLDPARRSSRISGSSWPDRRGNVVLRRDPGRDAGSQSGSHVPHHR